MSCNVNISVFLWSQVTSVKGLFTSRGVATWSRTSWPVGISVGFILVLLFGGWKSSLTVGGRVSFLWVLSCASGELASWVVGFCMFHSLSALDWTWAAPAASALTSLQWWTRTWNSEPKKLSLLKLLLSGCFIAATEVRPGRALIPNPPVQWLQHKALVTANEPTLVPLLHKDHRRH